MAQELTFERKNNLNRYLFNALLYARIYAGNIFKKVVSNLALEI